MPTDPFVPSDPRRASRASSRTCRRASRCRPRTDWRADRPGDLGRRSARRRAARLARARTSATRYTLARPGTRPPRDLGRTSTPTTSSRSIAEIASKRAASFGRAPVMADVDVAIDAARLRRQRRARLRRVARSALVHDAAHDYAPRGASSSTPSPDCAARAAGPRAPGVEDVDVVARVGARRGRSSAGEPDRSSRPDDGVGCYGRHSPSPTSSRSCGASLRRLAEDKIAPARGRGRRARGVPVGVAGTAWRDAGFVGLAFPEEFGGQGGDSSPTRCSSRRSPAVCASSSLFTFISKLGMTPVLDHGSDALKQRVRPAGRDAGSARRQLLPVGGRRRAATSPACARGRSATATTTC